MPLNPTIPQNAAGIRNEPPLSPPVANGTTPAATAAAPPAVEPPGDRSGSHGFRVYSRPFHPNVNETAPGRVKVTFYARDPLTTPLPPIPPQARPDLAALPVGLSEDGTPFCLRLLGRHGCDDVVASVAGVAEEAARS